MVYDPNTPSEAPPPPPSETPTTPPPEGPPSPPNEAPPGGPTEAPPGGPPEDQPIERVIAEERVAPWPGVVFGWGAMVPLALAALDPRAARRGEAPPFLARLRPAQMAAPALAAAALPVHVA